MELHLYCRLSSINDKYVTVDVREAINMQGCNLVFTIPECLQNSKKWSLPVKHTFYFVFNVH
jgi:hypothetical protein